MFLGLILSTFDPLGNRKQTLGWYAGLGAMWYDVSMPAELPTQDIENAEAAIQFARLVRKTHARRTQKNSPRRAADIEIARARLKEAMTPLRSEIGRFARGPQTVVAEEHRALIRATSRAIQSERRKLTKMSPPPTRKAPHA